MEYFGTLDGLLFAGEVILTLILLLALGYTLLGKPFHASILRVIRRIKRRWFGHDKHKRRRQLHTRNRIRRNTRGGYL
jgi:hypothetical protein